MNHPSSLDLVFRFSNPSDTIPSWTINPPVLVIILYYIDQVHCLVGVVSFSRSLESDTWELHQALPLKGSWEAYNPHQAVYLIVVV